MEKSNQITGVIGYDFDGSVVVTSEVWQQLIQKIHDQDTTIANLSNELQALQTTYTKFVSETNAKYTNYTNQIKILAKGIGAIYDNNN